MEKLKEFSLLEMREYESVLERKECVYEKSECVCG